MIRTLTAAVLLAAPNAFAGSVSLKAKSAPLSSIAGPASFAAPAGALSIEGSLASPSLGVSLLPGALPTPATPAVAPGAAAQAAPKTVLRAAAPAAKAKAPAAAMASVQTLQTAVQKAEKTGNGAAAPIARAYDGSGKRSGAGFSAAAIDAPAVSAAGRVAPRASGLMRSNFADAPKEEKTVSAPQVRREPEDAPLNWKKAAAGFLIWLGLVGLVALEYGGIYYAFTHAPRAQPPVEQPYYGDFDIDDMFRGLGR